MTEHGVCCLSERHTVVERMHIELFAPHAECGKTPRASDMPRNSQVGHPQKALEHAGGSPPPECAGAKAVCALRFARPVKSVGGELQRRWTLSPRTYAVQSHDRYTPPAPSGAAAPRMSLCSSATTRGLLAARAAGCRQLPCPCLCTTGWWLRDAFGSSSVL